MLTPLNARIESAVRVTINAAPSMRPAVLAALRKEDIVYEDKAGSLIIAAPGKTGRGRDGPFSITDLMFSLKEAGVHFDDSHGSAAVREFSNRVAIAFETVARAQASAAHKNLDEPWFLTRSAYQTKLGVHQPYIAEISPAQYGMLPKSQKREYDAKRRREYEASSKVYTQWVNAIMKGYKEGKFDRNDPLVPSEVKMLISGENTRLEKEHARELHAKAHAENQIRSVSDVDIGDTVFTLIGGRYGKVIKKFTNSVRITPIDWTVTDYRGNLEKTQHAKWDVRTLQWLSYSDMEAKLHADHPEIPEYVWKMR